MLLAVGDGQNGIADQNCSRGNATPCLQDNLFSTLLGLIMLDEGYFRLVDDILQTAGERTVP